MYKLALLLGMLLVMGSYADTKLGSCTDIEPVAGFDINKFLGFWYVIQRTSTSTPCLSVNITLDDGHYKITEIQQHATLLNTLHHEHHTTGLLNIPNPAEPGKISLEASLLALGTTTFTVFMVDYENYAAVFTCQKLPLVNQWSAEILSRTPTLDMAFVDKVRTRLSSYNVDPFTLKMVDQKTCAKPGTQGTLIRTASNLATNVGGKINTLLEDPKR